MIHNSFETHDEVWSTGDGPPWPSFTAQHGRRPVAGRDFDPDGAMCQDDHEYFSGTGRYSDSAPYDPTPAIGGLGRGLEIDPDGRFERQAPQLQVYLGRLIHVHSAVFVIVADGPNAALTLFLDYVADRYQPQRHTIKRVPGLAGDKPGVTPVRL